MAEREMSGKVLLDKLYSGLNTMPAAEAARDFRRLNDDFLGKPADLTASDQHAAEASDADDDDDDDEAPPSPRARRRSVHRWWLFAWSDSPA